MHSCWLAQQKGASSCILFFSGWGMDPTPFRIVPAVGHDLLMFHDYREMDRDRIGDMIPAGYRQLHLLAWSMGVWAAGFLLEPFRDRFASAAAVNGTVTPIDDRRGIGAGAYEEMLGNFSPKTLDAFYQSMFTDRRESENFLRNRPRRPLDTILEELVVLRRAYLEHGPAQDIFTRKIVGSRDRIFTARCQVRAWGRDNCTVLPLPHFPFYAMPDWHSFCGNANNA
jgi:pimeloyl-[acyl-carrier protein] methyl ester esterase